MNYEFHPLNLNMLDIISTWRYVGTMEEIYIKPYYDNYNSLTKKTTGPGGCIGYGVYDKETLVGLFEYYFYDGIMEIGLAIAPNFIGKGLSKIFILAGIAFGKSTYSYDKSYVQLHVDINNIPAKKAYLNAGFVEVSCDNDEILMYYYL